MQEIIDIHALPHDPLKASTSFYNDWIDTVQKALATPEVGALAIVMPYAGGDHDDWRTALARDLARANAPIRVNVIGVDDARQKHEMLAYLRDAPGVTGHYLSAHDG